MILSFLRFFNALLNYAFHFPPCGEIRWYPETNFAAMSGFTSARINAAFKSAATVAFINPMDLSYEDSAKPPYPRLNVGLPGTLILDVTASNIGLFNLYIKLNSGNDEVNHDHTLEYTADTFTMSAMKSP